MTNARRNFGTIIVGASGRVGRLLIPHWRRASHPIALQYRNSRPDFPARSCFFWNPDHGYRDLERWVSAHGPPSCMIVLSGATQASGRDLNQNRIIAETCLEAASLSKISRVLIASSSAVYGNYLTRPYVESDKTAPIGTYGEAKVAMEDACARWASPGFEVCSMRIGNVAGADALLGRPDDNLSEELIIDRYENGRTPERSYIGPGTLAEVLLQLSDYQEVLPPVLNIASPVPVEMGVLADAAGRQWRSRSREGVCGQSITLNSDRLWSMISLPTKVSEPSEMIRQIEMSRGSR